MEYNGPTRTLSIPMVIPYRADQTEYEASATTSSIRLDGKLYRPVKQKYADNKLHLVLVEDYQTKVLSQSLVEWINTMTDQEKSTNSKSPLKTPIKEYLSIATLFACMTSYTLISDPQSPYTLIEQHITQDITTPPPQYS